MHWALLEGFRTGILGYLPDIAIGGGVRTVGGATTFFLTTVGIDGQISKPIALADSAVLTPYVGAQRLIIFADSTVVNLTPGGRPAAAVRLRRARTCRATRTRRPTAKAARTRAARLQERRAARNTRLQQPHDLREGHASTAGAASSGLTYKYEILYLAGQFAMDLEDPSAENANLGVSREQAVDDVVRGGRLLLAAAARRGGCARRALRASTRSCRSARSAPWSVASPESRDRAVDDGRLGDAVAGPGGLPRAHGARAPSGASSRGHAERFDAVVWANDAARAAWDGAGDMPDGAMLVEEAIERTAKGDARRGLLVMEKEGGAWRFVVVDADGRRGAAVAQEARVRGVPRATRRATTCSAAASRVEAERRRARAMTAIAPTAVATTAATYEARSAGCAAAPSRR